MWNAAVCGHVSVLCLSAPVIGSATAEPTFERVVTGLRSISFGVENSVPIAAIPSDEE